MRVVVFGASGRTGRLVVAELTRRGHEAVGFGRSARPALPDGAAWVRGELDDEEALVRVVRGAEAVVICLGPDARGDAEACSWGTKNILAAAGEAKTRRIAAITGALIGHPPEELGWVLRGIRALSRSRNPGHAAARAEQEVLLDTTDLRGPLAYVLRPPRLVDGAPGSFLLTRAGPVPSLACARRSDLARALVAAAVGDTDARQGGAALLSEGHVDAPIVLGLAFATALATAAGLVAAALIFGAALRLESPGRLPPFAAALGAAALEGTVVGLAQAPFVAAVYPRLRAGRWVLATILGAAVACAVGLLPTMLLSREGGVPRPLGDLPVWLQAALLGLVAGPVLAAFQATELRRAGGGRARWLAGAALGWSVGMPLVFAAAGLEPSGTRAAVEALALLALAGALVGATAAGGLWRARRARERVA